MPQLITLESQALICMMRIGAIRTQFRKHKYIKLMHMLYFTPSHIKIYTSILRKRDKEARAYSYDYVN